MQKKTLEKRYPPGTRVRLIHMDDFQAPEPGTSGTVEFIDDFPNIHVRWDNGSRLALLPKEDKFEIAEPIVSKPRKKHH